MSQEEEVWLIVMFDLPVDTPDARRDATRFRKNLIDMGFSMAQFSVYSKYTPTLSQTRFYLTAVKSAIPPCGGVRVLKVTDRQYSTMLRYENTFLSEPERAPEQLSLFDDF
jgi:CRISPR-associated protein Cas2